MLARIKFALITGFIGLVFGLIAALMVREKGGEFPTYVVTAFTASFAFCGAIAKKEWAEAVLDIFFSVFF